MQEFTPVTKDLLDELLAQEPNGSFASLAHSDWFGDHERHTLPQKLLPKYEKIFETAHAQVTARLGQPVEGDPVEGVTADSWFPEALRLACWDLGDQAGTFLCLSLVHHDAETPIGVMLGKCTKEHIRELGG